MNFETQVLVVDDNPTNLKVITSSLEKLTQKGCKILVANNAERALMIAKRALPGLILLDINLPDKSGYEVCIELKSESNTKDIPIIFLSALNDLESKLKGFHAGGIDYITKPFQKEEVNARVETQLKIHLLKKQIEQERNRSEELLLNILPKMVADELKEKGHSPPRFYDSVTVLFSDFVDFTSIAEQLGAQKVIEEVDFCFKTMDKIFEENGLEKIKTIGDAYLCVGGLPQKNTSHPIDAVNAGLAIQQYLKEYKAQRQAEGKPYFEARIGIHTGPVSAGIVGINKFAYDIWGDTVNTAARLETKSEPGKVNISETTFELVKNDFPCIHRGKIEAKNKGKIEMYFVEKN